MAGDFLAHFYSLSGERKTHCIADLLRGVLPGVAEDVKSALVAALAAWAPGADREAARAELADLILTLGAGLCQSIVIEALRGRDYLPLCERLQSIVSRELELIRIRFPHHA